MFELIGQSFLLFCYRIPDWLRLMVITVLLKIAVCIYE